MGVLVGRREVRGRHPLGLNPQHHHRIGVCEHVIKIKGDLARPRGDPDRHQSRWAHDGHPRSQGAQKENIGPSDSAVQDVADDHHAHAVQITESVA